MNKKRSLFWGLKCVFWYWFDHGIPLLAGRYSVSAWWHGFYLLDCYNSDDSLKDEGDTPREAVAIDVSYWGCG